MRVLLRSATLLVGFVATSASVTESTATATFDIIDQRQQSATTTTTMAPRHRGLNVIVVMKEQRPHALLDMKTIRRKLRTSCDADTPDHVAVMVEGLKDHAKQSHAPVLAVVAEQVPADASTRAQSLWISNEVSIRDATPELVDKLRELPEVEDVRVERIAHLPIADTHANVSDAAGATAAPTPTTNTPAIRTSTLENTWALERIQATQAWQQGFDGTGIRVAVADSGVLANHESLAGRMLPDFGWFDGVDGSPTPIDLLGHGTSVMSILAGGNDLGVAPQATWLACRACDRFGDCDESWMLTCAQFLLCPFNADAQTDCSKRPHVINMSWNYDSTDERLLEPVIDAWLAAGIVPVFSNGNTGSRCKTVRSPADWTSGITVGATTSADNIASLSARGPNGKGEIKPDLTAPGIDVVGAKSSSPSAVATFPGTSAAAPFVSGAVALMLQANPSLSPSQIKTLLTTTTDQTPLVPRISDSCLATASTDTKVVFPNNVYGHGRLNVLNAVTHAVQSSRR